MAEEKKTLRYREFTDGHAMAMDEEGITKEKFKMPEYKCLGGLFAAGNMQMEVAAGSQYDKLGKALRMVSEKDAETKRREIVEQAFHKHLKASKHEPTRTKHSIKAGDTVRNAEGKKYIVLRASVDMSDSGSMRHLVMSLRSQKSYKISEHLLTKL